MSKTGFKMEIDPDKWRKELNPDEELIWVKSWADFWVDVDECKECKGTGPKALCCKYHVQFGIELSRRLP